MSPRMRRNGNLLANLVLVCFLPAIALSANDIGTLTIGKAGPTPIDASAWLCLSGYTGSGGIGSYSPTGLTGGKTVVSLYDVNVVAGPFCNTTPFIYSHNSTLRVSGFSIDPGQAWITSVTCNGIAKTGVSASTFTYSGGNATWGWSSDFNLISKSSGTNVGCTISH